MKSSNPIWERLETDTEKSYEAFCIYRDMGARRSLRKVAEKVYGKSTVNLRYVEEWSTNHNWQERVAAYDAYLAEERRKRKEQERVRIEGNVLKDYHAMRKAIEKRLKLLSDTDYKANMGDLHSLLALMKTADDYARRAVGLPDKITENKNDNSGTMNINHNIHHLPPLSDDTLEDILEYYEHDETWTSLCEGAIWFHSL